MNPLAVSVICLGESRLSAYSEISKPSGNFNLFKFDLFLH